MDADPRENPYAASRLEDHLIDELGWAVGQGRNCNLALPSLRQRIVGSTADGITSPWEISRGEQVIRAAKRLGIDQDWWFAVDDDMFGWSAEYRDRLVKTNGATGLSDQTVQQTLRYMLARFEP